MYVDYLKLVSYPLFEYVGEVTTLTEVEFDEETGEVMDWKESIPDFLSELQREAMSAEDKNEDTYLADKVLSDVEVQEGYYQQMKDYLLHMCSRSKLEEECGEHYSRLLNDGISYVNRFTHEISGEDMINFLQFVDFKYSPNMKEFVARSIFKVWCMNHLGTGLPTK